jgi:sugar/nucleoside kinase (ribokinase family)
MSGAGYSPEIIVEDTNRLAAYACSQQGAMPPVPDEMQELIGASCQQ